MPFLKEAEPPRHVATEILPGIRRIVAENPTIMTYYGTNTYLLEGEDGLTVIDPGPDSAVHVQDVLAAAAATPIRRIVLTHSHHDHQGAAAALQEASGAPVIGYKISGKKGFEPDIRLDDGQTVAGLTAIFTPGHAADHLCFAYRAEDAALLFSGDHVMSWSSSIVSPPDGDMRDYYRSLDLLLHRADDLYLAGHGPPLRDPQTLVAELLAHRRRREATIVAELEQGPAGIEELATRLYAKTDILLHYASQRNVLAHMQKLQAEEIVTEIGGEVKPLDDLTGLALIQRDGSRRFALRPTG